MPRLAARNENIIRVGLTHRQLYNFFVTLLDKGFAKYGLRKNIPTLRNRVAELLFITKDARKTDRGDLPNSRPLVTVAEYATHATNS